MIKLKHILFEAIAGDKIECDNCTWSWEIKDGGDDLYICHKCGHDNTPQLKKENMIKLKNILSETYIPTVSDVDIIAATIVGEAGGEGYTGMLAVKNVLQNRAKKKGTSPAKEAIRPKQFSMWNKATSGVSVASDFVPEKIQSIIDTYKSHSKWDSAVALAKSNVKDITGGATSYYASGGSQSIDPPYWAKDWTNPIVIGNHTFGN